MKLLLPILFLLGSFVVTAQKPAAVEQADTIFGLIVVIDTIQEKILRHASHPLYSTFTADLNGAFELKTTLVTAVWQAYTVTRYTPPDPSTGAGFPRVLGVGYYRFDTCTEIPFHQIIAFKH